MVEMAVVQEVVVSGGDGGGGCAGWWWRWWWVEVVLVQEVVERTPINLWMTEAQGFGRQMKDSMDS